MPVSGSGSVSVPAYVRRVSLDSGGFEGGLLFALPDRMSTRACDLPHADLTDGIIGCFFDVARELGYGFAERVHVEALRIALVERGFEAIKNVPLRVPFRGRIIGDFYADLVVNRTVLIEVKATAEIEMYAEAQILNYLKCAGGGVGLVLNFGKSAKIKRYVLGDPTDSLPLVREDLAARLGPPASRQPGAPDEPGA